MNMETLLEVDRGTTGLRQIKWQIKLLLAGLGGFAS